MNASKPYKKNLTRLIVIVLFGFLILLTQAVRADISQNKDLPPAGITYPDEDPSTPGEIVSPYLQ